MNVNHYSIKEQTIPKFPKAAKSRLIAVGWGWFVVAAVEAIAYTVLALAILHTWSPVWVLMSALTAILVTIIVTRSGFLTGVRLAGDLFTALGHSLARAKLSWFNDQQRAQVHVIISKTIPGFMSVPAHQFQTFLHAPLIPLFLSIGLIIVAGFDVGIIAFILLFVSLCMQFAAQRALIYTDEQRDHTDLEASKSTSELIDHVELLRTATGPVGAIQRIEQRWEEQEQLLVRINRISAVASFLSTVASFFPIIGLAIYFLLFKGSVESSFLLASFILISRAAAPLTELATAGLTINDLISSIRNFTQVTNVPELSRPLQPKVPVDYAIEGSDVGYEYLPKKLDFYIPFGGKVWIKGPSGSGKTTLLELIMRFDDPQQGQIKLGGIPLSEIEYEDLVKKIAYVTQDPVLMTGSLADNIRMSKPDATDQEVEAASIRAGLGSVLQRSSDGIKQSVGQQGTALSGGERQRVAIARALLKEAPILILDEATSALDEITERDIVKTINNLDCTVIFVTHRDGSIWEPTQTIALIADK